MQAVALRVGYSPIKGSRHLDLPEIEVDRHGVIGDRRFCFVDLADRRVLRTVQHPRLLTLDATLQGDRLAITLPDGTSVVGTPTPTGEEIEADYWGRPTRLRLLSGPQAPLVSRLLGREVALAAADPGAVIYGAGLTVLTRASLEDLSDRLGDVIDPARFRASAVVETDDGPYAEDTWDGRLLQIGTAVVRVGTPVGRCAVIDLHPITGERDTRALRELASYRVRNRSGEPCFGVNAHVVEPGRVPVGLRSP